MEIGEFHWKNGWYFKRNDDGSVRIQVRGVFVQSPNEQVIAEAVIPKLEWESIERHCRGELA